LDENYYIPSDERITLREWLFSHKWVVALGGVVVLLLLMLSFTLGSSDKNPFLPYYEVYQPTHLESPLTPWEEGILARYQEGEYRKAMWMLESYCEKPHTSVEFKFMLGSAYLEEGRIQLAIDYFTPLVQYKSKRIRQNALWYLAIAHIKRGNHAQADGLLATLLKEDSPYSESALELRLLLDV